MVESTSSHLRRLGHMLLSSLDPSSSVPLPRPSWLLLLLVEVPCDLGVRSNVRAWMRYLSLGAEVGNAGLSVVKHSLLEVPEVLV